MIVPSAVAGLCGRLILSAGPRFLAAGYSLCRTLPYGGPDRERPL